MTNVENNYREFTLDNGLLVALQNTPTKTISGQLRVHHGGLHELPGEEGLAHLVEHTVMMGGGRKYSPEKAETIMRSFGYINALTNPYETIFPVGILADDLEFYLSLVSDVVFNPRFDGARVEQERQRVLREIADTTSNLFFQEKLEFNEALYGRDSPFTYSTSGKKEVVAKATLKDLRTFHERGYHPNNMDLILVGGLPENAEELIAQYFADKPKGGGSKYVFPIKTEVDEQKFFHVSAPELLNYQQPESSSVSFILGFLAPNEAAEDSYALNRAVQILGEDMNSRLHRKLSQEMGLAYGVRSNYDCGKAGAVFVEGNVHALHPRKALEAVFNEMKLLKQELVDKDTLKILNRKTVYKLAKHFQTDEGHISAIQAKLDLGLTQELHLQRSEAITPEMIREAARKYFPAKEGKYVLWLRDPLKEMRKL